MLICNWFSDLHDGYSIVGIQNASQFWLELFAALVNSLHTYHEDQSPDDGSSDYGEAYPIEKTYEFTKDWITDIDNPDRNAMIDDTYILR